MILFYAPNITEGVYALDEEESRHCQRVLRLREKDIIHLTDGKGTLIEASISDARSRQVTFREISRQENYGRRDYKIHLAVAPTKNTDRFEWFLEKATEIGIDVITPLNCEHSERRHLRTDRLTKVITAAVKQSLKAYHPVLNEMTDFKEFVAQQHGGQLFIAHLDENEPLPLQHIYQKGADVTILIGPEGDFSETELAIANKATYHCISLGKSRLRTETAAIVACHTIQLLNQ